MSWCWVPLKRSQVWLHLWHWLYLTAAVLLQCVCARRCMNARTRVSLLNGAVKSAAVIGKKDVMKPIIHSVSFSPAQAALQQAHALHWLVSSLWARQRISTSHSEPLHHFVWMKTGRTVAVSVWPLPWYDFMKWYLIMTKSTQRVFIQMMSRPLLLLWQHPINR